jgi:phasin family protein
MDAAAETLKPEVDAAKATVEQFTATANTAFKDGVDKTLAAVSEANTQSKKNLEAVVASVTAAAKGAETLGAQAVAYSKAAFETQVNAAKALATAKTPQELFELQTAFAKGAFETYVSELSRMSETFQASFKDSLKPLNERVTETVGKLQATR